MKKAAPSKSLPYWNRPLNFHRKFLPFRTRKNKKGNTQSIHWSVCARTALARDREGNLVLEFGPTRFARTQGPITWPTREEERGISLWSLDALSQAESFSFFLRLHASPCPWWLLLLHAFHRCMCPRLAMAEINGRTRFPCPSFPHLRRAAAAQAV